MSKSKEKSKRTSSFRVRSLATRKLAALMIRLIKQNQQPDLDLKQFEELESKKHFKNEGRFL